MWLIFAIISTILVSTSSIMEKKVLFKEHALEFSATLSFYCFLISIPIFYVLNESVTPGLIPLIIIAITSVIGELLLFS